MSIAHPGPGLAVLAASALVFVSGELFPLSSLTAMASALNVSEGRIGLLLSGYALVVAATAWPVTRLTRTWDRRLALVVTMVILGASGVASALAVTYWQLALCRLVMALGHGLFWSTLGASAARLVPVGSEGRATGIVFAGNALAFIAGLPALNALSHTTGWRVAAAVVGVAALLAALALTRVLPPMPVESSATTRSSSHSKDSLRAICILSSSTLLVVAAYFTTYTYVTPILEESGVQGLTETLWLAAFGVLGLIGITATAKVIDAHPRRTLLTQGGLTALAFALAVTLDIMAPPMIWLCVLALGYSGLAVSWQSGVIRLAPTWTDEASALYVTAFQIGIAAGPVIGSLARTHKDSEWMYIASLALSIIGLVISCLVPHGPLVVSGRQVPRLESDLPPKPPPGEE